MAKKKPSKTSGDKTKGADLSKERTSPLSNVPWYKNNKQLAFIIGILVTAIVCFSPALKVSKVTEQKRLSPEWHDSLKQFTNWDDPVYIVDLTDHSHPKVQPVIEKLDGEHIKMMFSPSHDVSLNYHPLTMLSLAINYKLSGLEPYGYFLTNILFHLFNTFLVFIFLYRLSGKKFWVGAISAALFAIHPMHVESVAWASERKDVLYCFFFLASCITYLSYVETKQVKYIIYCLLLFLASCLSKAMAIPFPLILLLIDFYLQRKFTVKTIAEKTPFFLLTLIFGVLALQIQSKEAIADFQVFTLPQRFMFAAYGFNMYWIKLFLPTGLSAFYPYPAMDQVNMVYWSAPFISLAFVFGPFIYSRKNKPEYFRLWVFGMGFFIAMVAMVLQFISVGAALMADRYSYLPYIGAFFILASFVNKYFEDKKTNGAAVGIFIAVSLVLAVACYVRVGVWNDSEKLWTDVIAKYPYKIEQNGNVVNVSQVGVNNAYKNRGNFYRERNLPGDMDKAFADYEVLVKAHAKDVGAYTNMGNFYGVKGQFDKALEMYNEAIKLKPDNFETFMNRGITYSNMGQHQKAIDDFQSALKINPGAMNLYANIAFEKLQMNKPEECISDCDKLLAGDPNNSYVLFYRGTAEVNIGKINEAVRDLSLSVKLNPNYGNAWFNLSIAYTKLGNKQAALDAALNAKKFGYAVTDAYLNGLK